VVATVAGRPPHRLPFLFDQRSIPPRSPIVSCAAQRSTIRRPPTCKAQAACPLSDAQVCPLPVRWPMFDIDHIVVSPCQSVTYGNGHQCQTFVFPRNHPRVAQVLKNRPNARKFLFLQALSEQRTPAQFLGVF